MQNREPDWVPNCQRFAERGEGANPDEEVPNRDRVFGQHFVGKELVVEGSLSASCGIVDVIDIVMRHCNRSGSVWVAWNLR